MHLELDYAKRGMRLTAGGRWKRIRLDSLAAAWLLPRVGHEGCQGRGLVAAMVEIPSADLYNVILRASRSHCAPSRPVTDSCYRPSALSPLVYDCMPAPCTTSMAALSSQRCRTVQLQSICAHPHSSPPTVDDAGEKFRLRSSQLLSPRAHHIPLLLHQPSCS